MPESPRDQRLPATDAGESVVVGMITGASGIAGAVSVQPLSDQPDRFSPGSTLCLGDLRAKITSSHRTARGLVIKLEHVSDRDQAAALRGVVLTVPADELRPLPEGSYYYYQIIGIDVWDEQEEYLGKVSEIISTGGNDVYVIRHSGRQDRLIPALADVLLKVSPDENRMVVRVPDGL